MASSKERVAKLMRAAIKSPRTPARLKKAARKYLAKHGK